MGQVAGLRRTGSASIDLAWVAAGRFDGYVDYNLGAWDMAAGLLLVREAGGIVTDAEGGQRMFETGSILAGNQAVHGALARVLEDSRGEAAAQ
jgi:myo-inositol-1(or 4)-monophosphatase